MKKSENGARKIQILRVAQEIFAEKGLANASVAEIARKANVADSILYHYFKNKEDLLFYSLAEKMLEATNDLNLYLEGISGAIPKLEKMIWFHLYINDRSSKRTRIMS